MLCVEFRFLAGRYHGNALGHHVNEGQIEWPPSPWRILRALISVGYCKLGWDSIPSTAEQLFAKLATQLPSYRLPPAGMTHSRHYMPLCGLGNKTTMVFDTCAIVGNRPMYVEWPIALEPPQRELLSTLLENLGYLGRAESLVQASLCSPTDRVQDTQADSSYSLCLPLDDTGEVPSTDAVWEVVDIPAPMEPNDFLQDHELLSSSKGKGRARKKPSKKQPRAKLDSLVSALQWDTAEWKAQGWSRAPGLRRAKYWRKQDCLGVQCSAVGAQAALPESEVRCMLWSMATESRSLSALPSITRTLPQAELHHRAIVGRAFERLPDEVPAELTGKTEDGRPARGHGHLYIAPLSLKAQERIDHILVFCRNPLSHRARMALQSLRTTYGKKGAQLHLSLIGEGNLEDLHQMSSLAGPVRRVVGSPRGGSTVWRSATPFVPPRYIKKSGKNSLRGQIERELLDHGILKQADLDQDRVQILVDPPSPELTRRLRHFTRRRSSRFSDCPPPPVDVGLWVELRFETPVQGPIMLGYASHFGLGRFEAVELPS